MNQAQTKSSLKFNVFRIMTVKRGIRGWSYELHAFFKKQQTFRIAKINI